MESEIIVMYHCCWELFTIIDITTSLGKAVGMTMVDTRTNFSVHKENTGALVLYRNFPPQSTSLSKYYLTDNIWFHEYIVKHRIKN